MPRSITVSSPTKNARGASIALTYTEAPHTKASGGKKGEKGNRNEVDGKVVTGLRDRFLPDGGRPSLLRRAAGVVADVVATDVNRQLGPLLAEAGLVLERREPVMLRGLFVAALARRPG